MIENFGLLIQLKHTLTRKVPRDQFFKFPKMPLGIKIIIKFISEGVSE